MYGEGYSNGLAQTKHETSYVPRKTYGSKTSAENIADQASNVTFSLVDVL